MAVKQRGYQPKERNSGLRERRPVILISAEGSNKTETIYFRDFARDRNRTIRFTTGQETDPVNLALALIRDSDRIDFSKDLGDKAFCLIDSDTDPQKNEQILQAERLLHEHDYQLLVSSPCFEIWYICHYRRSAKHYVSSNAAVDDLKVLCPEYTKSCENMYGRLKDRIHTAIENAQFLEQACTDAGYRPHTVEYSPSTEVYKLADELLGE